MPHQGACADTWAAGQAREAPGTPHARAQQGTHTEPRTPHTGAQPGTTARAAQQGHAIVGRTGRLA
eukprot:12889476-Alexandrium_andersonii.AAC.1